jgi:hypothetical protein
MLRVFGTEEAATMHGNDRDRRQRPRIVKGAGTSQSAGAFIAGLIALGFLVAVLVWPTGDRNTQVAEPIVGPSKTVAPAPTPSPPR